jgi:hypothetical protein
MFAFGLAAILIWPTGFPVWAFMSVPRLWVDAFAHFS